MPATSARAASGAPAARRGAGGRGMQAAARQFGGRWIQRQHAVGVANVASCEGSSTE